MRNIGIDIIRAVGVDTGGCNIQFAVDPATGRIIVIEMNPRVSRSSALASKATGFPIAKIAAKLAIGYRLDEIPNDITKVTPASFEPTLDYVVVKVPRFNFEKFPAADTTLTTTMKSVGEAMAIGRNYTTALQKALRSLEKRGSSFHWGEESRSVEELLEISKTPTDGRIVVLQQALRLGATPEQAFDATAMDPWFIDQIVLINEVAEIIRTAGELDADTLRLAKEHGFSDAQIAQLRGLDEAEVRGIRYALDVRPVYKTVDTCAGEFPALTPYHYSSYDWETEVTPSDRTKVVIIGSGPNRIGQGVEFDYSCVHASFALSDAGYETIMVNCNPETVSTDYDTSDRLYFEPLTLEDVLEVLHAESRSGEILGVVCQLGGQTPLGLAKGIEAAGYTILGTSPEAIDLAEERELFSRLLDDAGLVAPRNGTAIDVEGAVQVAEEIGYRCSCARASCSAGRGMEIVYSTEALRDYFVRVADRRSSARASRSWSTASSTTRSSSTSTRCTTHRPVHRRRHGAPRGSRHPLRRLVLHPSAGEPRPHRGRPCPRGDPRDREGRGRPGAPERAVRDLGRRALRDRGEPAREPHRAVRVEGARHPARQGREPHHGRQHDRRAHRRGAAPRERRLARAARRPRRGQGGRAAVQAVPHGRRPHRRLGARTEMRSTGEVMGIDRASRPRSRSRRRPRTAECRPRARCSSPSPTPTSAP